MKELILFTDLDGTLLDHHDYSFAAAHEAIAALNRDDICWILNSSKTLAELRELRYELGQRHPLIVENGAGIAIPVGYSHPLWRGLTTSLPEADGFLLHAMGLDRTAILARLQLLVSEYDYEGFADMSVARLCELTGLDESRATKAMDRHFSEPLYWRDSEAQLERFAAEVGELGLSLLRGGRFVHVMGGADKGRAVAWLLAGFGGEHKPTVVALGDSQNDVAMLECADIAVVVRSPVHAPPTLNDISGDVRTTEGFGPAGWNRAVLDILDEKER